MTDQEILKAANAARILDCKLSHACQDEHANLVGRDQQLFDMSYWLNGLIERLRQLDLGYTAACVNEILVHTEAIKIARREHADGKYKTIQEVMAELRASTSGPKASCSVPAISESAP